MKKYISHILCMAAVGCCLTACSDFLDVTPRDKVLEADQYATETGIQGALNGLYRQFISTDLYGGNLSYTSLDAIGAFLCLSAGKAFRHFPFSKSVLFVQWKL